jgi:adenylate cyclase
MGDADSSSKGSGLRKARCAIVFVDLVESVQHYACNEALAIERWRRFADQTRGAWLEQHSGRLVRTDGDGLLLEFIDAARAVGAVFALHAAMTALNGRYAAAEPMHLRAGIHVAEVTFDEYEAYGAGVNLAQRITSLAQPGQTLVSDSARDGLVDGLHARVEDRGLRFVKHIDTPVRTFQVTPMDQPQVRARAVAPAGSDAMRPTLAVVPFKPMSGDAAHDALGHAIADDVIAALARHSALRVVSRLSTAAFRDISLDWTQLRKLLGATFVLSGRCYVSGSRVRLSLELAETQQGHVLWAETVRSDVQAVFDGQDDLVPLVVRQVAQRVAVHELTRVRSLPMDTLQSYTLYLGAEGLMSSLVRQDFNRAREALLHLADRHPRNVAPQALLTRWYANNFAQSWSADPKQDGRLCLDHASRALDVDPDHSRALACAGLAELNVNNNPAAAQQLLQQSLTADPQDPHAWIWLSAAQSYLGETADAANSVDRALMLSPLDPDRYLFEAYASMARIASADYASAIEHARTSLRLHALHAPSHSLLVASLWMAGQEEAAREVAQSYLKAFPLATIGKRTAVGMGDRASWREHLADAVRSAGVPTIKG